MPSSVDKLKDRIRRYPISPEFFPHMFRAGNVMEITTGIPEGAQFRGYGIDPSRNLINIFMEHESFDIVPECESPPEFKIEIKRHK